MIDLKDLEVLKNQTVYPTSNEKYVLTKRSEKIVRSPEYKLLGFLHNYSFTYDYSHLAKNTLDGVCISKAYVGDIEYGAFNENVDFMYLYKDKRFMKVDENLNVEWEAETDDYIRNITVDTAGNAYIVYQNSRVIHQYLPDGTRLRSFRDDDDVINKTRIYKVYVNPGRTEMYALGATFVKSDKPFVSRYKDVLLYTEKDKFIQADEERALIITILNDEINVDYLTLYAESFVDKYDLITGKRENHGILERTYGIESTDPYYSFDNIYVQGNNIYIHASEYIQKVNKGMNNIWKYYLAFNQITGRYNQLGHTEYDDSDYTESIYFVEDLFETNGHGFGMINPRGELVWKIAFDKSIEDTFFCFGHYKGDLYTTHKSLISLVDSYVLAVNDYNILFRTKNGRLVKIVKNNEEEIYSDEYYERYLLLADVIRDDVPEYLIKPLIVNSTRVITTENGNPIVIEEFNPEYLNPENYETYRLIGLDVREDPYPNGIIITKQQKLGIITNTNSAICTLNPIKAPTIKGSYFLPGIDIAGLDKARMIMTYLDKIYIPGIGIAGIDRAKLLEYFNTGNPDEPQIYEYPFYICGDSHIFKNNIITKKEGLTIITKKTGASIMKKVKDFYKYIYRRFGDIDIVLEFIKQSGILRTTLPRFADRLIHHTTHMIQDMQEAHIPVAYDLEAEKMFSYYFDGVEYPIRQLKTQIYLCNNLPFMRKQDSDSIYIRSMADLVQNEMIKPFIMFVDGKAIKWSNMTIVRNWEYSYVIITNIDHDISYKYRIDAILLPYLIRYGEDDNILSYDCERFLFDENGRYTDTPSPNGIRVEILDPKVSGKTYNYEDVSYITVESEYNQIASDKNILIFERNLFAADNIYYLTDHGKNIYTYDGPYLPAVLKTFYYIKANDSKNILNKIPHQTQVDNDIIINAADDRLNAYLNNFRDQFDYYYRFKYSYNENVSRAIEYIMSYDMSLLNRYYIEKSNVRCYCFDGRDIKARAVNGYLEMPRDRKFGLDDYVLVFKNGNLYDRYRELQYKANMFRIPINNSLKDDDILEIVHFKHVDNRYYTVKFTHMSPEEQKLFFDMPTIDFAKIDFARLYENNWYYNKTDNEGVPAYDYSGYLVKHLRMGHLLIWGNSESGTEIYQDKLDDDTYIQYPINYVYRNLKDEYGVYKTTEIIIEDRYYKYKPLNFSSSRQFHYMYYNVLQESQDLFDLELDFRFAQNKKQYMIFVNGKKLNYTDFELMIPKKVYTTTTTTTYTLRPLVNHEERVVFINDVPLKMGETSVEVDTDTSWVTYNRMAIKTNIPLVLGDLIEIVYVPDPYDEITLPNYIPNDDGIVELDEEILQYPFSKDLFLVFMNGKKVSNDLINDVNKHKIRIKDISNEDIENMKNITVCKYIIPDNILKEVYAYGDKWSDAVDSLSESDFHKLFVELNKIV